MVSEKLGRPNYLSYTGRPFTFTPRQPALPPLKTRGVWPAHDVFLLITLRATRSRSLSPPDIRPGFSLQATPLVRHYYGNTLIFVI